MSEPAAPSSDTPEPSGGSSAPSSSLSLGGALVSIVPQTVSAAVSVALVWPVAKQCPELWAAAATAGTWMAFVPAVASSLLVLAVASKSGLRDLAEVVKAAKGLLPGGKA